MQYQSVIVLFKNMQALLMEACSIIDLRFKTHERIVKKLINVINYEIHSKSNRF